MQDFTELWDFCLPISPDTWGPSGWQHNVSINSSSQLCNTQRLAESARCPIIHVLNKDAKQHWTHNWPLKCTTKDCPQVRLCTTDYMKEECTTKQGYFSAGKAALLLLWKNCWKIPGFSNHCFRGETEKDLNLMLSNITNVRSGMIKINDSVRICKKQQITDINGLCLKYWVQACGKNAKLSTETSMSSIVLGSNKFLGYSPDSRFLKKRLSL